MNVWLGWFKNVSNVNEGYKSRTQIPATNGRLLLEEFSLQAQSGHNDMSYRPGESTADFMITDGPEEG